MPATSSARTRPSKAMRRRTFFGLAGAAAITSLASAARAQAPLTPFVVSPPAGQDGAGLYYALRQGWFQQAGLDVSVQPASGAAAIPGVLGGAVQVAYANVFSLCEAHVKGLPIVLVAPGVAYASATAFQQLVVAGDSPLRTQKDFPGKTVAVSALGDMASFTVQSWLVQGGVDPATVHFVELRVASMPTALDQKRVDAIAIYEPFLTAAESKGARSVGKPFDSIALSFLEAAWFTTLPYATANRPTILRFTAALNRAQQYYDSHFDELIPLISDFTEIPPDLLRKLNPELIPAALNPAAIQPVIDAAAKYHAINASFPAKDFIFT